MKNKEVIERILSYHPQLNDYHGCDDYKIGNPEAECTGVVTAMTATIHVIKKAIESNANLLIVHEPTFYTSADQAGWFEDFDNRIYQEKKELLEKYNLTIWRDHDHMHVHQPDGIFAGVLKYLGWENSVIMDQSTGAYTHFLVDIPEMTLESLLKHLVHTIGINGARYMGDPAMKVKKVAIVGHLTPMMLAEKNQNGSPKEYGVQIIKLLEQDVDVIIPGEVIDWTVLSYIRDAIQLKYKKGMINLGHFNWEELGMKYAKDWISELLEGIVPVIYVPSEDLYQFFTR